MIVTFFNHIKISIDISHGHSKHPILAPPPQSTCGQWGASSLRCFVAPHREPCNAPTLQPLNPILETVLPTESCHIFVLQAESRNSNHHMGKPAHHPKTMTVTTFNIITLNHCRRYHISFGVVFSHMVPWLRRIPRRVQSGPNEPDRRHHRTRASLSRTLPGNWAFLGNLTSPLVFDVVAA